ncbi:MAG: hypothetical protein JST59_02560 [Actinobacteria bacterium]|nr:hypothetical protein [Actinomycetota bacterium]
MSYSLPQLTKDELQILYVIEKIDPLYREQEMCRLLLATFNRENINVKEKLKEYFPSKPETLPLRCLDCHYILADLPTIQCFFCGAYCHTRCLSSESTSKQQITIGSTEVWCCVECLPCSVCFCPISDPIVCRHCKTRFHRECGKTRDRLSEQTYECEDCLACDMCDKKLKNCKEGAYILVEEKIYCEDCHSITGEYCRVCMKSWKEHNAEWFQCN